MNKQQPPSDAKICSGIVIPLVHRLVVTRRVQSPAQISIVFVTKATRYSRCRWGQNWKTGLKGFEFNFTSLHPFEQISQNVIWYLPKGMEEIFKFRSSIYWGSKRHAQELETLRQMFNRKCSNSNLRIMDLENIGPFLERLPLSSL